MKGVACIKDEDGSARILVAVCKILDGGHTHAGAVLLDPAVAVIGVKNNELTGEVIIFTGESYRSKYAAHH